MPVLESLTIGEVEEIHLQELIDQKIQENQDLEYKRDAIGSNDEAKKEFLKDIVAFANTAGGHLVIGIEEADGVAIKLKGILATSADQEIRRLGSILENGIEPRLVGVQIRHVMLASGGYALLIRIPVSWNPPHRIAFARQNRFFARNSGGAYELSVEQLRASFLGGANLSQRIEAFRQERLARLGTNIGGPKLVGSGQLVIHIVPLSGARNRIDLSNDNQLLNDFHPLSRVGNINFRYNIDGYLVQAFSEDSASARSLCQVFQDGKVEVANAGYSFVTDPKFGSVRIIQGDQLSFDLVKGVERSIKGIRKLGVSPPYWVGISILDAFGCRLNTQKNYLDQFLKPLDRNSLILEPVILKAAEFVDGWQSDLRPIFDDLWRAFGFRKCEILFDDTGRWKGFPGSW